MRTESVVTTGRRQISAIKIVFVLTLMVWSLAACKSTATKSPPSDVTSPIAPLNTSGAAENSYAEVVSHVAPAVVTVRAQRRVRAPQQFPFMDDPFFRDFFGDRFGGGPQRPNEQRRNALGSGVIVSQDAHILTNHHVVDGAEEIEIELNDKRRLQAKLVGSDPPSDLAVLKVDATGLPVLPLGNSDNVRVGDVVLAIGNPLGVGQTVTFGIVSAKNRSTGLSDGGFEDFLQTDAPINQGNSGGALVNTSGELIGINSQILSPSGGNIGIGFAIPTSMARTVMEQLIKNGKVRRGQLGVVVQAVTSEIAASIGLGQAHGVIVSQVQPSSAAERAGLKQGDVITVFDGQPVNDSNALRNRVASTAPGTEVTLTVIRDNREQQLRATLDELAAPSASEREPSRSGGANDTGQLGIEVQPLNPGVAAQLGLASNTQGLVVTRVDPSGSAAGAGLRQGDVIAEANRQPVRRIEDLRTAIQKSGDRPLLLLINRRGQTIFVAVGLRR